MIWEKLCVISRRKKYWVKNVANTIVITYTVLTNAYHKFPCNLTSSYLKKNIDNASFRHSFQFMKNSAQWSAKLQVSDRAWVYNVSLKATKFSDFKHIVGMRYFSWANHCTKIFYFCVDSGALDLIYPGKSLYEHILWMHLEKTRTYACTLPVQRKEINVVKVSFAMRYS